MTKKAWEQLEKAALFLAPHIQTTVYTVNRAAKEGKNILKFISEVL